MLINSYIYQILQSVPVIESYTLLFDDTGSTTLVLNKPTGVVSGDLLLVIVTNDQPDPVSPEWSSSSDPAGWTFVRDEGDNNSDSKTGVFWKIADGGEGSTFTFNSVSSRDNIGVCFRISGVNVTTPLGVQGTFISGFGDINDIPAITTINDNSLVIAYWVGDGSDTAPFGISGTGWTEFDEIESTGSPDNSGNAAVIATKEMETAGSTGVCTVTQDAEGGTSDGYGGFMFSINPI